MEAVRRAVERTVQTTVGSAGLTRDRAQEVVDEVVTRAERTAEAAAGVSDRVREALHDLRQMTGDEMKDLRAAIERLANQVESLESRLESATGIRRPGRSTPANEAQRHEACDRKAVQRARSARTRRSRHGEEGGEEVDRRRGRRRRELAQPNAVDQAHDCRQSQALGLLAPQ